MLFRVIVVTATYRQTLSKEVSKDISIADWDEGVAGHWDSGDDVCEFAGMHTVVDVFSTSIFVLCYN